MQFTFSQSARKDVTKLPRGDQVRLRAKLLFWQNAPDPLVYAKSLSQHKVATHRFRFGSYRVLVEITQHEMRILRVRHRKDVYKW